MPHRSFFLRQSSVLVIYEKIRKYRATKPLFAMDFQNEAEYVGGCIAGGRRYLHINANGDIDPCVFYPLFRF